MRYYKLFYFLILITLIHLSVPVLAQTASGNVSLTGTVTERNGAPVNLATVSLINPKDSTTLKGTLTDDNGGYAFNRLDPGAFIVRVSFTGFRPAQSAVYHVRTSSGPVPIPPLVLEPEVNMMTGVNIAASRPLVEHQSGKTIVHVDNSILAVGNNALEILERSPGISVDENHHISLRGKHDVVVMINDKPTYLTADQLASLLSATDGGRIGSIEILQRRLPITTHPVVPG